MKLTQLAMLTEAKKKKDQAEEMEMDFDTEGGEMDVDVDVEDKSKGKSEDKPMGKAEVIACLKKMTPKDRAAIHTKLMAMVEKDEAAASE